VRRTGGRFVDLTTAHGMCLDTYMDPTYEIYDDTDSVVASGLTWMQAVRLVDSYTQRTRRLHWISPESVPAVASVS
jgi:hypothetical protein